eukprot:Rhum_TRINITY_DN14607_c5_g1::Rhum_TRINITY_DN14607_c5_g1_i3::g.103571::m.103571
MVDAEGVVCGGCCLRVSSGTHNCVEAVAALFSTLAGNKSLAPAGMLALAQVVIQAKKNLYPDMDRQAVLNMLNDLRLSKHACEAAATAVDTGNACFERGEFEEARRCYLEACAIQKKETPDSCTTAKTYRRIGTVCSLLGLSDEALAWHHKERVIYEKKAVGSPGGTVAGSLSLAETHCILGALCGKLGRDDEALREYSKGREILRDKAAGSTLLAEMCHAIAALYQKQGKHEPAVASRKEAYEIDKRRASELDLDLSDNCKTIAELFVKLNRSDEARCWYSTAWEIKKDKAPNSLPLADLSQTIADLCCKMGKYDEALNYYKQAGHGLAAAYRIIGKCAASREKYDEALAWFAKAGGEEASQPDSLGRAETYLLSGAVYTTLSRFDEALFSFKQAREIQGKKAPGSVACADTDLLIGDVYNKQGRYGDACSSFKQAREIRKNKGLAVAEIECLIGATYDKRGRFDEANYRNALYWYGKACTAMKKQNQNTVALADLYHTMGLVHDRCCEDAKAATLYKKALEIQEVQQPDSLALALTSNLLGSAYHKQDDHANALPALHKAREIREKQAPNSSGLGVTYRNLGMAFLSLRKFGEALNWLDRARMITEMTAPDSLDVAKLYCEMGLACERQDEYPQALEWFRKALAIRKVKEQNSIPLADTFDDVGKAYSQHGKQEMHRMALEAHDGARVIREKKTPHSLALAATYRNMSNAFAELGEDANALTWLNKARDIEKVKDPHSFAHDNIDEMSKVVLLEQLKKKGIKPPRTVADMRSALKRARLWREYILQKISGKTYDDFPLEDAVATLETIDKGTREFDDLQKKLRQNLQGINEDYVEKRIKKGLPPIRFRLCGVERVVNVSLECRFELKKCELRKKRDDQATWEHTSFHGTRPCNLPRILNTGLLRFGHKLNACKTKVDDGWFGSNQKGVYVSGYADYTLKYSNGGSALEPGDKVRTIVFRTLPGKSKHCTEICGAINPTEGYDSHSSPSHLEWYLFDEAQLCPEYVFELVAEVNYQSKADDM